MLGLRTNSSARWGLLTSAIALGGCADDLLPGDVPRPPIVWEGENVRIGTDLDLDDWCPGNLQRLDDYVGAVNEVFDVPNPRRIDYFLFEPPIEDLGVCPRRGVACAFEDHNDTPVVIASELSHDHEIVHSVGYDKNLMPPFFEEGSATYWGDLLIEQNTDFRTLDIRDILQNRWGGGMNVREYALASNFISYLIHRHGLPAYQTLSNASSWFQPRSEFETAFHSAIGLTLDEAIDDYETTYDPIGYCQLRSTRSSFFECGQAPEITVGDDEVFFDFDISCANPDVLGPRLERSGSPRIWQEISIEVVGEVGPDGRTISTIRFETPAEGVPNTVEVEIKRCDTDCVEVANNRWILAPNRNPDPDHVDFFTFGLRPGRYLLRVSKDADDPGPVRFRW